MSGAGLPSADIAEVFDSIVAGARNVSYRQCLPTPTKLGSWSAEYASFAPDFVSAAGGTPGVFALHSERGDRILGCSVNTSGNAAVDVTYTLYLVRADQTAGVLATLAVVDHGAVWSFVSLASSGIGLPFKLGVGESLYLEAVPNAANARMGAIILSYDRPLP